jgi:hypothetical protein
MLAGVEPDAAVMNTLEVAPSRGGAAARIMLLCADRSCHSGLSGIVSFQYVVKKYDSRQAGMTTFYDFIKLNE